MQDVFDRNEDQQGPAPLARNRQKPRLELNVVRVVGAALAAASAAVAASWLGVAGTVLGAIVMSIVATVGTALYSHSLERSRYALVENLPVRVLPARSAETGEPATAANETRVVSADGPDRRGRPRPGSWRPWSTVPWGTVAVSSVVTIVLCFGLLTTFEWLIGKPVSSLTRSGAGHGTTVTRLVESSGSSQPAAPQPDKPATSPTPTQTTQTEPTSPTQCARPTQPTSTAPTSTVPTQTNPTQTNPTQPTSPSPTSPTQPSPTPTQPTSAPTTSPPGHLPSGAPGAVGNS